MSVLRPHLDTTDIEKIIPIGLNPAHDTQIETINTISRKTNLRFSKVLKYITRDRNFGINLPKKLFPNKKVKRKSGLINNNTKDNAQIPEVKKVKVGPSEIIPTTDIPQYAWTE